MISVRILRVGWVCLAIFLFTACASPAAVEISPDSPKLDAAGKTVLLSIKVLDQNGNAMSTRGMDIAWSSDDSHTIGLTQDGMVTAKASGDATVRVEIVGTDVSAETEVDVVIPDAVRFSKEKIRLVVGETAEVSAEVITSRGAFIDGLQPSAAPEDSSVVIVESVPSPNSRGTLFRLTGRSPGTTQVLATHGDAKGSMRVAVFEGDEEIHMVGSHISKKKERDARVAHPKKEKPQRFEF